MRSRILSRAGVKMSMWTFPEVFGSDRISDFAVSAAALQQTAQDGRSLGTTWFPSRDAMFGAGCLPFSSGFCGLILEAGEVR